MWPVYVALKRLLNPCVRGATRRRAGERKPLSGLYRQIQRAGGAAGRQSEPVFRRVKELPSRHACRGLYRHRLASPFDLAGGLRHRFRRPGDCPPGASREACGNAASTRCRTRAFRSAPEVRLCRLMRGDPRTTRPLAATRSSRLRPYAARWRDYTAAGRSAKTAGVSPELWWWRKGL